jgi:uncharacterized protein
MKNRIVLAGGGGFLGRMLRHYFTERDWEVIVLTRGAGRTGGFVHWDGQSRGAWCAKLEGATAVMNLSGRSVDCRYTDRNRKLIMDSRIRSTRILGEAIAACAAPPKVWLNSSTATIYRHSHDRAMDEWSGEIGATPEAKDEFSVAVAKAWEREFADSETPGTRKLALRTAMVMGAAHGGVFRVLRRMTRWGLGGAMGDGCQFVSWIHADDFCRAVAWLIEKRDLSGVVNLAAPNPLPNCQMMAVFRRVLDVAFGLSTKEWMLEIGAFLMRTETELIIKSRRVIPDRLVRSGFRFRFEKFTEAVAALEFNVREGSDSKASGSREVFA